MSSGEIGQPVQTEIAALSAEQERILEAFKLLGLLDEQDRQDVLTKWEHPLEDEPSQATQILADDASCLMDEGGHCSAQLE